MSATPEQLIGATLLAAGRPVKIAELSKILDLPKETTFRVIQNFEQQLKAAGLGFELETVAGGFRLVVPSWLVPQLAPILAPPPLPPLSQAALEVLAIIAYKQPVTRAEIESMRGGGSASTVITLQERELIKVVGRSEAIGQPLLYGTTEKFLLEFGLSTLRELPPLEHANFAHLLRG